MKPGRVAPSRVDLEMAGLQRRKMSKAHKSEPYYEHFSTLLENAESVRSWRCNLSLLPGMNLNERSGITQGLGWYSLQPEKMIAPQLRRAESDD